MGIDVERDHPVDRLLVIVLGLLLNAISARNPGARPGLFDKMQLTLGFQPQQDRGLGRERLYHCDVWFIGRCFRAEEDFQLGLALFVVSCVLIALANNGGMVIAGRMIQGAAGATILACGLSLLSVANTGQEQLRAVSLWGAAAGQTIVVDGGQILPESL
jgi:MFS family permease